MPVDPASVAESAEEDFIYELTDTIATITGYQGSGGQLKVEAPFVSCTQAEVVKTGLELNVPYELTWSCYEGGEKPCGVCGTCIDRAEAFRLNGVKDPALDR